MKLSEVVDNLRALSASLRRETFIYDFLLALGTPKATIARLKSGDINLAKKAGCTLLKSKVYFESVRGNPDKALEAARTDRTIAKSKARFFIATDFKTLMAYDAKADESLEIPISDLHDHYAFFLPLAGMEKTVIHSEAEADVKAADQMAQLYDLIRADNPPSSPEDRHALNVFLTRLIFCYFAEDTGIFHDRSFTSAVATFTQADGSDLADFLQEFFLTLNLESDKRSRVPKHLTGFPYVNGGLFRDSDSARSRVPKFSTRSRQKLIELGAKNWKEINPDIFGSMFQSVVDDEKRSELGMHYTSVPNILNVIRPLFLDDLQAEYERAKGAEGKLNKLLNRIYHTRIFDPACGSGNFLIIAYKELRRLEMKIFKDLQQLTTQLPLSGIAVSQFYGIELDDFAHEVAILALWLAEHQMNVEFKDTFGRTPAALPLKEAARIVCENATRIDWEEVCPKEEGWEVYILGNPPYAGSKLQTKEQKRDIEACLSKLGKYKDLDYIACWFVKATDYIRDSNCRYAFVTTNSLNQGVQVELLWSYIFQQNQEIFFAIRNFRWQNNAAKKATVTCSIIGVRNPSSAPKTIFQDGLAVRVQLIGPYLVPNTRAIIGRRTSPLADFPAMDMGNQKFDGGHLVLSKEQRDAILARDPSAERFIRPLVGTTEFIESTTRYCFWLSDDVLAEARGIPEIDAAIRAVAEYRSKSTDAGTKKLAARPHQFRDTKTARTRSLLVSRTSSENRPYIPCGFLGSDVIVADAQVIYDPELWIFGVVSSRLHYLWAKTTGGGLETRIRYSSQICYNNFPFPRVSTGKKQTIARLSERILAERERHPGKTIGQLYDPDTMPPALLVAHRELDTEIEQCYRARPFSSDDERLEYLLSRHEQLSDAGMLI